MIFRFYYVSMGDKHYEDIKADTFRQARNIFFENHKTAFKCNVINVWTVNEQGELITKIY